MEGNLNCDFFCRLCNNSDIEVILDFGNLALTGVFKEFNDLVELTPLVLVRCKSCGLVQLKHSYDLNIFILLNICFLIYTLNETYKII